MNDHKNENAIRTNCPMRHKNGNCLPQGGFCTAVSDSICEGLHHAYTRGKNTAYKEFAKSKDGMLHELEEYRKAGTPEECISRKEWMAFSIDDIRKGYIAFVKGMREYVDDAYGPRKRGRPTKDVADALCDCKSADTEPVRHGHWRACKEIFDSYGECEETDAFSCSECGKTVKPFLKSEYCPRCGAKMDAVSE